MTGVERMKSNVSMLFKSRAFKRGSFSAAFTVIVVAAVVVLNVVVGALASHYYLYVDMTSSQVFKISDEGFALLDGIDSDVNIIFCDEKDTLESSYYKKLVYNTALELSAKYENYHISNLNIYKNPAAVSKYKTTQNTRITDRSVIIESGGEFRVYDIGAFYVYSDSTSSTPWAYNGEYKLISAILQVTASDHPKAYFTTGHGETLVDEALWLLFSEAGYEVATIDLMNEEIDKDARFVIINDPVYDFQGISADTAGKRSEIEKIDDFLDDFGCLMVFVDPDTGKLPVLYSFLEEWGIKFDGRVIKDYDSALTTDGYSIVAQYATGETTGADLISPITKLAAPPKAIVKYATPIRLTFTDNGSRNVSPILMTTKNAVLANADEADIDLDRGQFNLMTLSRETRYVDNEPQYSYVLAAGTTNFATNEYIGQKAYSNGDIIYSAMKQMGKERVPAYLPFKPFDDTALDITADQAVSWTAVILTVFPIIALIICAVVLIRRKHA